VGTLRDLPHRSGDGSRRWELRVYDLVKQRLSDGTWRSDDMPQVAGG
jgi:hypothetical protein